MFYVGVLVVDRPLILNGGRVGIGVVVIVFDCKYVMSDGLF